MPRKRRGQAGSLEIATRDCAGIGIGKDARCVAVDPDRRGEPARPFDAFTPDLEEMAARLSSCGGGKAATEPAPACWIPVFEVPGRAGFEAMPAPPRTAKRIPGRRSDVLDCRRIRQLLSCGLLRGAFRPGGAACPPRSCVRQAKRLTGDRSRCVLHMRKASTGMNARLGSAVAGIAGATGRRILRAIAGRECDPRRLAALRDGRVRAGGERIATALAAEIGPAFPSAQHSARGRGWRRANGISLGRQDRDAVPRAVPAG